MLSGIKEEEYKITASLVTDFSIVHAHDSVITNVLELPHRHFNNVFCGYINSSLNFNKGSYVMKAICTCLTLVRKSSKGRPCNKQYYIYYVSCFYK